MSEYYENICEECGCRYYDDLKGDGKCGGCKDKQ